jgi:hypothetical protein
MLADIEGRLFKQYTFYDLFKLELMGRCYILHNLLDFMAFYILKKISSNIQLLQFPYWLLDSNIHSDMCFPCIVYGLKVYVMTAYLQKTELLTTGCVTLATLSVCSYLVRGVVYSIV